MAEKSEWGKGIGDRDLFGWNAIHGVSIFSVFLMRGKVGEEKCGKVCCIYLASSYRS